MARTTLLEYLDGTAHVSEWNRDLCNELDIKSDELPGADTDLEVFLAVTTDSEVGGACMRLIAAVEMLRTFGMESEDFAKVRAAAVHTMVVWYFG